MPTERAASNLPLLTLAPDVTVVPQGLRKGSVLTQVSDLMLVVALTSGLSLDGNSEPPREVAAPLDLLHRRCLLSWCIRDTATALPMTTGIRLLQFQPHPPATGPVPLSRFALLRRSEGGWLLESGRSRWVVRLTDSGVAGLGDITLLGDRGAPLLALLAAAGMLDDRDIEPAAQVWEPHDRYFASRSRSECSAPPYRLAAIRPPDPGLRAERPGETRIPLPAPTGPQPDEPGLWEATETRRTVREFADRQVTLEALGFLLWRTMRVIRHQPRDPENRLSYDHIYRPVASGGAMGATDLWLVCEAVTGLPQGVWRYDPFTHELAGVKTESGDIKRTLTLLKTAPGRPAVIGLLTVRHARAAWKYSGITYALELKDVGVIMHAIQLTAGALGLGMCIWGSGPTEEVASLLGVDPEVDVPIGEFVLGLPGGVPDE